MMKPDRAFVRGFLSWQEADALLDRIRSEAAFRQNYIQLYGHKAIPRLEAWYGSWDYPYAKGVVLKAAPMPGYLRAVIDKIEAAGFRAFDAVLINRYRDGRDYISPHSDDDYGDPEPTIPSQTLGAARPFRLAKIISGSKLKTKNWRRRRDSNPRDPFESNGFQDRRFQPLTHSSVFNSNVLRELAANL